MMTEEQIATFVRVIQSRAPDDACAYARRVLTEFVRQEGHVISAHEMSALEFGELTTADLVRRRAARFAALLNESRQP